MAGGNLGAITDPATPPDRPAFIVIGGDLPAETWSFRRISARADAVARGLVRHGLALGSTVAILAENHAEYLPAFLGIMRAGMIACPLNWKLPAATVETVLDDAGARLALVDYPRRSLLPATIPVVSFDDDYDRWLDPGSFTAVAPGPETIACLMYTSGSTGRPKGVPIGHAGYLAGLGAFEFDRARATGTVTLVAAPLYHLNAQSYALSALSFGSTVVLLRRFDVEVFARSIEAYRIDEVSGVPTMFAMAMNWMDAGHPVDCRHVTLVSAGSAPLSELLLARLYERFPNAVVGNSYGTTETGIAAFGPHPRGLPTPPGSLGYPLPGIGVRLVGGGADDGVLLLKTPMMAKGYHRRPEETRARFVDGWYRTGDLMRRDASGFYFFVGRADDMLLCGGENVYPAEVERMLESHPEVRQAAVVGVPDPVKGQVPVAFVVPRAGSRLTPEELDRFALEAGPAYARPRRIELVAELPLAGTNKLDRKLLADRAAAMWGRSG